MPPGGPGQPGGKGWVWASGRTRLLPQLLGGEVCSPLAQEGLALCPVLGLWEERQELWLTHRGEGRPPGPTSSGQGLSRWVGRAGWGPFLTLPGEGDGRGSLVFPVGKNQWLRDGAPELDEPAFFHIEASPHTVGHRMTLTSLTFNFSPQSNVNNFTTSFLRRFL